VNCLHGRPTLQPDGILPQINGMSLSIGF
jgi:hypothetical protein